MGKRAVKSWRRLHQTDPPVTMIVTMSPLDGDWIVHADGWALPPHIPTVHRSSWEAQRAADNALLANMTHDCKQRGCDEWVPLPARMVMFTADTPDTVS